MLGKGGRGEGRGNGRAGGGVGGGNVEQEEENSNPGFKSLGFKAPIPESNLLNSLEETVDSFSLSVKQRDLLYMISKILLSR